jgi:hypothetical protein
LTGRAAPLLLVLSTVNCRLLTSFGTVSLLLVLSTLDCRLSTSLAASPPVSFSREVAPLLLERCFPCHGPVRPGGGYQVTTYHSLLEEIEPGTPEKSKLFRLVDAESRSRRMPKDKEPLTEVEKASVRRWIEEGARFDGEDPGAPLLRVVPPRDHPPPPEAYPRPAPVAALAFHPAGTVLAAGGYREVTLWDPATGKLAGRIGGLGERTAGLAFNPDGSLLAAACGNPGELGEVKLIDPAAGRVIARPAVAGDAFLCIAIDPGGTRVAAGGADRSIRILALPGGREERTIEQHTDWVLSVAFSPDGKRIVSASRDGTAKIFNAATGELESTYTGHGQPVFAARFSPDGAGVWSAGADRQVHLWTSAPSISTAMSEKPKDEKQIAVVDGYGGPVFALVLGTGFVYSAGVDPAVFEHGLPDRKPGRVFRGHRARVLSLALHEGTGRLASGGQDGEVRIWRLAGGAAAAFPAAPGVER